MESACRIYSENQHPRGAASWCVFEIKSIPIPTRLRLYENISDSTHLWAKARQPSWARSNLSLLGDLNIWNAHNPRERFWASRTKQLHASHVTTYDRLWSCLPYMRPLVTIIADSLSWYGEDEHGGRVHDLLGTRCDPYINTVLSGETYDFHCHSNLTRAVTPFGLNESDVHDVINLFQVTGLDDKGRYFMNPCPAQAGDHIEFLAEQDVLMALSTTHPIPIPI